MVVEPIVVGGFADEAGIKEILGFVVPEDTPVEIGGARW